MDDTFDPEKVHRRIEHLQLSLQQVRTGMEPRKSSRPLPDLVGFFGAPDEIAPVNRKVFDLKVGELIARTLARVQEGKPNHRKRGDEQSE